jgi:hypothetical protein
VPPIGAPSWCLNENALERFNRSSADIPYDHDTDGGGRSDTESKGIMIKKLQIKLILVKKRGGEKTKKIRRKKEIRNINQNNFFYVNSYYNLVLNR